LGQQAPARAGTDVGEFMTNQKNNSFERPREEACRWPMMVALKVLHDRALTKGGNAVIHIVKYCNTFANDSLYECHAGALVAGVALKGTVVKLRK
jgi:hypothetical protein